MKSIIDTGLSLMRQTIRRYGFLEKNSRVLVGVSGGVDSLTLIKLLVEYNEKYSRNWEIHACHVNPQFPKWNAGILKDFFIKNNIRHTIVRTDIYKKIAKLKKNCYVCSRERRKKLLEVADRLSIFQIALAHHKEDVAETIFLNMIYNGEISTLIPKQSVIQGRFFFIRPLYYFDKKISKTIARAYNLPVNINNCPYYKKSKREMVRKFLAQTQRENPNVYKNIFRSIFHIKKSYMPH